MFKKFSDFVYDIFHRWWFPFFHATYLPRKKEIRINRDDLVVLLNTWMELEDFQKEKWIEAFNYLFYKEDT